MFLHLSVSHSVDGGCLPHCIPGHTHPQADTLPPGHDITTPWADTPPAPIPQDTGSKRAVRTPLECILVSHVCLEIILLNDFRYPGLMSKSIRLRCIVFEPGTIDFIQNYYLYFHEMRQWLLNFEHGVSYSFHTDQSKLSKYD